MENKGLTDQDPKDPLISTKYFMPDSLHNLYKQYFVKNHADVNLDTLSANRQCDQLIVVA